MKKFKITYQLGNNIRIKFVEANDVVNARYKFYMETNCNDILNVEEVDEEIE